jgi:hypothetical protein
MAQITKGLTANANGKAGVTAHFAFSYDDSLDSTVHPGQPEPARTNALIATCESDYQLLSDWFGGISLTQAPANLSLPISVQVSPDGGGAGWGPPITLKPGSNNTDYMRYLMISEVSEMFMKAQNKGWFAPDGSNEQSCGEGLSRFLAQQFLVDAEIGISEPGFEISPSWLNSSLPASNPASTELVNGHHYGSRADYVNNTLEYDHGIDPATGCAMLFIYYLTYQLGYSNNALIAAAPGSSNAASCLRGVYRNLTGDNTDPFPFFKQLLGAVYPDTAVSSIAGPNPDNPFPVATITTRPTSARWFLVHNEIRMQPGAAVSAVWRSNDTHLDLFATGTDGAVWSTWWEGAHGWQPWFLVHNEIRMQPGATVTAVWRSNDTHLDLFATGTDGAVWSTWWEGAHGWQPWFLVHNEIKMTPGEPVAALWRSNDTHLDLFATGTDGTVWSTWWEGAHGWQPWFELWDNVLNNVKMQPGAPVTAIWRSNQTHLDLFVTGTDGAVWSIWWEAATGW